MKRVYMAIDPGKSGAIVVHEEDSGRTTAYKMPETPLELYDQIMGMKDLGSVVALMEQVGDHRKGNSAASSAVFSRHVGRLEMALIAAKIPQYEVVPTVWMNAVAPGRPKGMDGPTVRARKLFIKDMMQRRYPNHRIIGDTADAFGILTYMLENRNRYN